VGFNVTEWNTTVIGFSSKWLDSPNVDNDASHTTGGYGIVVSTTMGLAGMFMAVIVTGTSAFTALWKPDLAIIMMIVSLAVMNVFGMITIGWSAIISLSVIGVIIMYRLRS